MACCGGGGKQRPAQLVEEVKQPTKDPLHFDSEVAKQESDRMQLDDILLDEFGTGYLLRFSQSEYSSENVAFLIAMKELHRLPKDAPEFHSVALKIADVHFKV
jgi:hypothetical protein